MAYIANTPNDIQEMLAVIGAPSIDALFSDVPAAVLLKRPAAVGPALSEYEMLRLLRARAAMNHPAAGEYLGFLGAGAYEHFIPSAVNAIAQRGEILTAYTPYQAEASQGTLQVIYEFQSMICSLTGMDAANASMYDGASAVAEAALMAVRVTGRPRVVVAATLHPNYLQTIVGYSKPQGIEIVLWPEKEGVLDLASPPAGLEGAAGVILQHPNFWGHLEDAEAVAKAAKTHGALTIAAANPMSYSVLEPPGAWGADIAAGETQPMGLPLNFGGPYAGYFATKAENLRKMPGRIVGKTVDHEGREGFTLTLQTREQHIRRERATSNICTNQGLCATMVTLWMSMIGKSGFERLGLLNLDRAGRLREGLLAIPGIAAYSAASYFNEFTVRLPIPAEDFYTKMRERGVLPGLPAIRAGKFDPRLLIVCATETKLDGDLTAYLNAARAVLENAR